MQILCQVGEESGPIIGPLFCEGIRTNLSNFIPDHVLHLFLNVLADNSSA